MEGGREGREGGKGGREGRDWRACVCFLKSALSVRWRHAHSTLSIASSSLTQPSLPPSASRHICVAAKIPHVTKLALDAIRDGKCVVIGLLSTGEAVAKRYVKNQAGAAARTAAGAAALGGGGGGGGREGGKEGGRKSPTTYQLCPLQLGVEQAGKVAMQALISRNELIRKGQPLFNICSR